MAIRRAIISVSNKVGLSELAPFLKSYNVEILSTGGTRRYLESLGVETVEVSQYTGFPEIMDGRVKTLHPRIHGGILNIRDSEEHQKAMAIHGIKHIDLILSLIHISEPTRLGMISYAVFCLKKKNNNHMANNMV